MAFEIVAEHLVGGLVSKMLRYRPTLSMKTVRARIATPRLVFQPMNRRCKNVAARTNNIASG
jgi:hypothetical protein